jgi:hypothetical protein
VRNPRLLESVDKGDQVAKRIAGHQAPPGSTNALANVLGMTRAR